MNGTSMASPNAAGCVGENFICSQQSRFKKIEHCRIDFHEKLVFLEKIKNLT